MPAGSSTAEDPARPRPWRDALSHPDIRRLELGWGLSLVATFGYTVAMLVYAYDEGGPALVAVYGVASTLPGAVVSPLLMSASDQFGPDRVLRLTTTLRTVLIGLAAGCALMHGPAPVVLTLAAAAQALSGTFRPIQATMLPWLARTPGELTAATVAATVTENVAALSGPALAGIVLATMNAPSTMVVSASCMALAALSLRRLSVPSAARPAAAGHLRRRWASDAAAGGAALIRIASPGGMVVLTFAQTFVRGALLVLVVVLALDTLALGDDAVGWLNAAIGFGGLAGAALAARTIRLSRLGRSFVMGITIWGLAVLTLSGASTVVTACLAMVLAGIANSFQDTSAFILMPRVTGAEMAGGALGAFEVVVMLGMGLGALAAPLLADLVGVRTSLLILGLALAALAVAYAPPFARIDHRVAPQPRDAALLGKVPIFAPLPVVVIEELMASLEDEEFDPGDVVVREGEPGRRFYLVAEGTAAVSVRGVAMPHLAAGDGFGEIALLRGVPRTATVTALEPLRTLSLGREEFLAAMSGNRVSKEQAEQLATRRLESDPPVT